ncbi:ENDO3c domain-containing protein [Aphelenchoides bicaudatus]|nr:ENDO3c domain-containing protein [Aphelenchoides bicaudatus]
MSDDSSSSVSDIEDLGKDPRKRFMYQFPLIQKMRAAKDAPVDTMGCFMLHDTEAEPPVQRFQIFVSLLLSPRTKDEMTAVAIKNLREHGLTIESIIETPTNEIEQMIKSVGMWKAKAGYLKHDAVVMRDDFNSDVPHEFDDLVKLKGVGPKIASLTLMHCYDSEEYIGVDVHVHRISNRLWINTKKPEDTEKELKKIVPKDLWREVGVMLVGFGQTICKANPLCHECLLRDAGCPVAKTYLKDAKKTTKKKAKKRGSR